MTCSTFYTHLHTSLTSYQNITSQQSMRRIQRIQERLLRQEQDREYQQTLEEDRNREAQKKQIQRERELQLQIQRQEEEKIRLEKEERLQRKKERLEKAKRLLQQSEAGTTATTSSSTSSTTTSSSMNTTLSKTSTTHTTNTTSPLLQESPNKPTLSSSSLVSSPPPTKHTQQSLSQSKLNVTSDAKTTTTQEPMANIRFMLPSGKRLIHKFRGRTDTIATLRAFLTVHFHKELQIYQQHHQQEQHRSNSVINPSPPHYIESFSLNCNYPKKTLEDDAKTIEEEGLCPQAVIMVQDLDS